MNNYKISEIHVGTTESFEVTVTDSMMRAFLDITGDINPLHTDKEFASDKGYPDRVVYGMLTASFLSTLAGVYLPGECSLIHSVESKLTRPVYVGDTLTVSGTVTEKSESVPVFIMKTLIKNQNGESVLRGKMQIEVKDER